MSLLNTIRLFKEYLQEQRNSPRTIEAYVGAVMATLANYPHWNKPVAAEYLLSWRRSMVTNAIAGRCSDSTVRVAVAGIRKFYLFCASVGIVTENPSLPLRSLARVEKLPRPMPVEDLGKLFAVIPDNPTGGRDAAMINLFLNGLRNVEVCRLSIKDVDYEVRERTLVLHVLGKGNKEGEVVLSPSAATLVAKHVLNTQKVSLQSLDLDDTAEGVWLQGFALWKQEQSEETLSVPLFSSKGIRMTRQRINRMFRQYRDTAHLHKSFGPHSLRHTCGTELLEAGTDIRVVQEILRHKNLNQTLLYTQVRRGPKATAMRRLPIFEGVGNDSRSL